MRALKGHGHNVSAYIHQYIHSVGVIKSRTLILNATPSQSRLIIRILSKYLGPNVVTVAV